MQIVFRPDGSLDDSDINGGTWDFTSPTGSGLELASNAWRHTLEDVRPWIVWGNTSEDNTNLGQRYIAWLRRCDVESATEFPLGITLDEKQIAEAAKLVAVLERIKELCLRIDPSLRQAGPERGTAFAASFYNTFACENTGSWADYLSHVEQDLTKISQSDVHGTVKFINASWATAAELAGAARSSRAVRYALLHNHPFVIEGLDAYLSDDKKSLFEDEKAELAGMTDEYIEDRALFLAAQANRVSKDGHSFLAAEHSKLKYDFVGKDLQAANGEQLRLDYYASDDGKFGVYFEDKTSGMVLTGGNSRRYIFGSDRSDTYDGSGYHVVQHVYGGAGNDIIITGDGDECLG